MHVYTHDMKSLLQIWSNGVLEGDGEVQIILNETLEMCRNCVAQPDKPKQIAIGDQK